jgi:predicted small secreted protein
MVARSIAVRRAAVAATLLASLALAACNTVAGAGQDVSAVGHGVSNGATSAANHM